MNNKWKSIIFNLLILTLAFCGGGILFYNIGYTNGLNHVQAQSLNNTFPNDVVQDNKVLLPIGEIIDAGYRGMSIHLADLPKDSDWNIYWARVHYSASYYLEAVENSQDGKSIIGSITITGNLEK